MAGIKSRRRNLVLLITARLNLVFLATMRRTRNSFDWHVVQFIIVCLPSVAVYLVAQYARRKMKIMDAELGGKKGKEEEKKEKEEAEQKALEEEAATKSCEELMEMKESDGVFWSRFGVIRKTIGELDDELQDALYQFLEERGITDELAGILMYMKNKDKGEYIRWMESVKSYVEQK